MQGGSTIQAPWRGPGQALCLLVLLAAFCSPAAAELEYSVTYTITVNEDGSALWRVEYRTLLADDQALADFTAYVSDLEEVSLPPFRALMEASASQAAAATGRNMAVSGITGSGTIQTSPTGQYGVVIYTVHWEGFVREGPVMTVGDAFAGGLYLEKDNTLIIRYPDGYAVRTADPAPDSATGGLTWYGLRPFGAGEPRVVLEKASFPVVPVAAALVLLGVLAFAGFFLWRRGRPRGGPDEAGAAADPPSPAETTGTEERILALLGSRSGGMLQSEIGKSLGLPKSTVSAALNDMHARGVIVKVKKGRENLIRLA